LVDVVAENVLPFASFGYGYASQCLLSFKYDLVSKAGRQIHFLLFVFNAPLSGGTEWGYVDPVRKCFPDYPVLSAVNCKQIYEHIRPAKQKESFFQLNPKWTDCLVNSPTFWTLSYTITERVFISSRPKWPHGQILIIRLYHNIKQITDL